MKKRLISLLLITCILIGIINIASLETNAANPDYSSIFVASYYSTKYPDLKAAGITSDTALLNHFITSGMKEGRQGSEEFNVYVYMNNYPDLKAAFGNDLPKYYLHYMNAGKAEGRVARGNASAPTTAPTTTVPTAQTVNSGAIHTAPAYSVFYYGTDKTGKSIKSYLSYKAGDTLVYWNGTRTRSITQKDVENWNYNPYGLTSGTSAITGSAKIGDVRYINYSLSERTTMLQPHSVKMECYAINKNGVPIFRRYGSSYNVYTQAKNLVPLIDSITPTMNVVDVDAMIREVGIGVNTINCTEIANINGSVYGQFLIESYNLVSDVYNHEICCPYMGNGVFLRYGGYGKGHTETLAEMKMTSNTQPGTFYVSHSSQK